jgi:phage gpG-like protein
MLTLTAKSNAGEIARGLRAVTRGLVGPGTPQGARAIIGREGLKHIRRHFTESKDPEGRRWKRLKYPRKRGSRAAAKPLENTGHLRDSIDFQPSGTGGKFRTDVPYARIHDEGGKTRAHEIRPRKKGGMLAFQWKGRLRFFKSVQHPGSVIDQRKFMGLGRAEQEAIAGEIEDWFVRTISAGGLSVKRGRG